MGPEETIKEFNSFANAKKQNASLAKLVLIFSFLVIVVSMVFTYSAYRNSLDKVLVIDKSGEYLQIKAEKNEDLFVALIKNTCAQFTYYLNTFERTTVNTNQAHAAFYCADADLKSVFAYYKGENSYYNVLQRGVIYKCELEQVTNISTEEPYHVAFVSNLTIIDGGTTLYRKVYSEGTLVKTKPQFPENVTGFYFNTYKQTIKNDPNKPDVITSTTNTSL